jgi:UDP-glucose 4-epimerase
MAKLKILITGSNGYIGQHLCKILHKHFDIDGLDLHGFPKHTFLQNYISKNITSDLSSIKTEYHAIIHLAALVRVGESVDRPYDYYNTNINGTTNILKNLKFKQFIFGSTGAASAPASPYAFSKIVAEDIVKEHCNNNNIPFTTFRFYNVTGTDGFKATNPDGLFYKLNEAIETGVFNIYGDDYDTKDGTAVRDYVHVNEICLALEAAIDNNTNSIENLGHGKGYSVKEIAETFKYINNLNFKINYAPKRPGDPAKTILDNVSKFMLEKYTLEEYLKIS